MTSPLESVFGIYYGSIYIGNNDKLGEHLYVRGKALFIFDYYAIIITMFEIDKRVLNFELVN